MFYIYKGYFILSIANPYLPHNQLLAYFNIVGQGFLVYWAVVVLPLQFIFRYCVICNTPLTTLRYLGFFFLASIWPLFNGLVSFYTFEQMDEEYDNVLRSNPFLGSDDLPAYGVADTNKNFNIIWHFVNCSVLASAAYGVITFYYLMTKKKLKGFNNNMTMNTKKIQKQMEKVIFVQVRLQFILQAINIRFKMQVEFLEGDFFVLKVTLNC